MLVLQGLLDSASTTVQSHASHVRNAMIVNMAELGGGAVLSGATSGRRALAELLRATAAEPTTSTPVLLNFEWVEVATSSFLREGVLVFRDIIRSRRSNLYPVVANPNSIVREELEELLSRRGGVLMGCYAQDSLVIDAFLIGHLDPKQKLTYDLVQRYRGTDAGQLMKEQADRETLRSATAWNNRLASLAALGVIAEVTQGRSKRYKPLFDEI